jgi:phosphate transport system permease protein
MTYSLCKIIIRPALPGILTGMILALAISVGETAPLIYTANFSNSVPTGALVHEPVGYLTYAAYTFWDEPVPAAQHLASDASLILVVMALLLILGSRLIVRLTQRYSPDRQARLSRADRREAAIVAAGVLPQIPVK